MILHGINSSAILINGVDAGLTSGAITSFALGIHTNAFAVRFTPGTDNVQWVLQDPSTTQLLAYTVRRCCRPATAARWVLQDRRATRVIRRCWSAGTAGTARDQPVHQATVRKARPGPRGQWVRKDLQACQTSGHEWTRACLVRQGRKGAPGSNASISFMSINVSSDGTLALPTGAQSVVYLATTNRPRLNVTLPNLSTAVGRFTVRRVDNGGRVLISSGAANLEGGREIREGSSDSNVIALNAR